MDAERFNDVIKIARLMKSADPANFDVVRFVSYPELTQEQKALVDKEFGRKSVEQSIRYNYFETDYF